MSPLRDVILRIFSDTDPLPTEGGIPENQRIIKSLRGDVGVQNIKWPGIKFFFLLFLFFPGWLEAQLLPGFRASGAFDEQQMVIENDPPDTRILINAPLKGFTPNDRVLLVFFALPNGNTIEQTFGKKLQEGDDWHFNIQHIGAQTRYLRNVIKDRTVVVACLETRQKSWPAWKANTPDFSVQAKKIVEDIKAVFRPWNPEIVLNGHSGGGRFVFSYLDGVENIPGDVVRIAFLDSNYGYEDSPYGSKLMNWLDSGKKFLCTLAYNDSVVMYQGKPLVSPTGGTWYRSRLMLKYLSGWFSFHFKEKDSLLWYTALRNRVEIILKPNPEGKIYHTVQVERNGFIHSMLSGTRNEQKHYSYFGERVYDPFIADDLTLPIRRMNFPKRNENSESGSRFSDRVAALPKAEREEEIFRAIATGNMPDFLRTMVTLSDELTDAQGTVHKVIYEVMPDYLSVGHDTDFCRMPMNPFTAQKLAGLSGGSLLTSKISDLIYKHATVRLFPYNYIPIGDMNEQVYKFRDHNNQIEKQFSEATGHHGQLTAGIKKDVIIAERLARQPGKVVIYGWHLPGGQPVQPAYSGHTALYVDYSHGIRLINNQILLDGKPALLSELLKDPVLYKIFSDEGAPIGQPFYSESPAK
jgi:hypothetical protein